VIIKMKFAGVLAVLALLAGCGNDKSGPNPVVSAIGGVAKAGMAKMKASKADETAASRPAPTPAQQRATLEEGGKPLLRVASATLGQNVLATVADSKGDVQTWKADGATFSQRNGVLIQTRGLGADLMSAEAPSVGQLRSGGSYQRLYYFLGADDQGTRRTYECTASVVGPESIEILARSYATTHVTEVCERTSGRVTNDYWIEGKSIRKSRQWVSAAIGYLEFERVVD
jgi:hypothetical protein